MLEVAVIHLPPKKVLFDLLWLQCRTPKVKHESHIYVLAQEMGFLPRWCSAYAIVSLYNCEVGQKASTHFKRAI